MRLDVLYQDQRIGQLLGKEGRHYFEYDREFIADPKPLSPQHLPVQKGVFEHRDGKFLGLPGLFYDSLPDHFGMEVVRKHFREKGNHSPTPLQILSYLGDRTMGALSYAPAEGGREQEMEVDLVKAALSARQLIEHEHGATIDPALLASGATAGGAMPKILIAMNVAGDQIISGSKETPPDMEPWLLKLDTKGSTDTSKCRLEYAYFQIAKECGIQVPDTKLVKDHNGVDHFAIRRFDRGHEDPNRRIHIHSYAGLFHLDFTDPGLDYDTLLRRTRGLTGRESEVRQQYRRILFNILAHNRDDHAKNFSFQMNASGEWTLTPAYDLLFCQNDLGGNWMLLNGKRGRISRDDLLELAKAHSIPDSLANEMIEQIQAALGKWPEQAKAAGLGEGYAKAIHEAIKENAI